MIGAIIFSTAVLLLLALFILLFAIDYKRRKIVHIKEKAMLQSLFKQELLKTQLEIQEQTFNHISQEIHDNVGQILSLAKMQINIMNERADVSIEMLSEVKENIGKAMTDLRDIARSLSSDKIRTLSVLEAVCREAERVNKTGVMHIEVSSVGPEQSIEEQKKIILFRVIQECLQNAIKHARATIIDIIFTHSPVCLEVILRDNGIGFDREAVTKNSSGLGLLSMKTRVELAGGVISMDSAPGKGTSIVITIPYA